MTETVKLPGIGPVQQRYVWAGGAAVLGIAGFAYYRRSMGAAEPVETLPADGAGEGLDDGAPWPYRPPGGSTVEPGDGGSAPKTVEEWSARAVDALEGSFWDRQAATTAVAKYIAQSPSGLTGAEQLMMQAALALVGTVPGGKSYRIIPAPATTVPPAPAKVIHRMQWVQVKTGLPGTIAQKQRGAAVEAAAMGVWRPSGATLNSVIAQAASKNRVRTNTPIRVGTTIWIYKAVRQG